MLGNAVRWHFWKEASLRVHDPIDISALIIKLLGWSRIDFFYRDQGKFRTSLGPSNNNQTGKWTQACSA